MMIPKNIIKEHIIEAIGEIDKKGVPKRREPTKFKLCYNDKFYPPKYVISLANKYANGKELSPSEFSGGRESNNFLSELGFSIIGAHVSEPETSQIGKVAIHKHNERCSECKNVIIEMFRKIYGSVKVDHKIDIPARVEKYKGTPYYQDLGKIFSALKKYRGYKNFVRLRRLHRCDLFVPHPGFIVELDESQHFTAARNLSLSHYPKKLVLGFDIQKWKKLCKKINAKDNDPEYRDEQRAWYDTLRDFLPLIKGFKPTVRIYMGGYQWCSLNPDVASDIAKFQANLKGWTVEIREDPRPSLSRVILAGNWNRDVETARELLGIIYQKWPKGKKVECLITCGAFLNFSWQGSLSVGNNKYPNKEVVEYLQNEAKKRCTLLLRDGLFKRLKKCTDYLTIGIDSYQKDFPGDPKPHIELVALIDLRTRKYYWTGKSYPRNNQENHLIRINDLRSHFVNCDFGKVMILGCHDLTVFNPRSKNAKDWRRKVNREFKRLAKTEKPICVLQHPHTTVKRRSWLNAWNGLRKTLPSVERYLGAGRYHDPDRKPTKWDALDDVLKKTKCGNTIDFIVRKKK